MWQDLNLLYQQTISWWTYPLLCSLANLTLTLLLHKTYKKLKYLLLQSNIFIPRALLRAIYPPLLILLWTYFFKLLYQTIDISSLVLLPKEETLLIIHKLITLILGVWAMLRFFNILKERFVTNTDPTYQNLEQQIANFILQLFYYMLLVLFIVGALYIYGITIPNILIVIGKCFIIANFTIVLLYITYIVLGEYIKNFASNGHFLMKSLIQAIRPPIMLIIVGACFFLIIKTLPQGVNYPIAISYWEVILLSFFWILYRATLLFEEQLLLGNLTQNNSDKVMAQTTGKLSRVIIVIIVLTIFFAKISEGINFFTAIFGSSTIVLGIAAQDIFANYLSGGIMYLEGKFEVGHWIYSVDQKVEGTIECIGLRTTDIRTFDKRLLTVPNAFFSSTSIVNASKMTNRRIKTTIGIKYIDYNVLDRITQHIRVMLQNHPGIDQNQTLMVHFTEFGTSSLNINIYTFTKTKDWKTYRNVQQNVFLRIIQIIEENGGTLAFPTRTLHLPSQSPEAQPPE